MNKIEMMLLDAERPRDEPRKIAEFHSAVVPGSSETISWNGRVFAVLGRAFALEEHVLPAMTTHNSSGSSTLPAEKNLTLDVALIVQQVGGPPMLVATPAPLKI